MDIVTVLIDDLELDPNNARRHSKKNLDAIAGSLEAFGQRKPIVVWRNRVVAGNGTLVAARSLGWKEIVVAKCPDDWDEVRVKAFALADNRSAELAEWDEQVLTDQLRELELAEFDVESIGFEAVVEPEPVVEDELPEVVDSKSKLGDIWQIGDHVIACGDASDKEFVLKVLSNREPDAIVTDAPYGISIVKNKSIGASVLAKTTDYKPVIGDEDGLIAAKVFDLSMSLWPKKIQCWWGANHFAFTAKIPDSSCWLVWDKKNGDNNFADAELAWTNHKGAFRCIVL